jgi:UDP-glucose 4-epimerase
MASAMRGQPVKIFGQRGTVRDYVYVSDVATGIISALEHGRLSETYNLGSGIGLSNMDVIEIMSPLIKDIGSKLRVDHLPERVFDVKTNVLDSKKLGEHTGWKLQVGFREGLLLTRDWLREYKDE